MKIALLFFGQLRWMDNPHTVESHHRFIIDKYDTDIFGFFWEPEKSEKLSQSGHVSFEPSPSDKKAKEKIQQKYKFTKIAFEEQIQFTQSKWLYDKCVNREWPEIWESGWFEKPNAFNNVLSQLYCVQKVARMFDNYVLKNLIKYDFVITSRPDICIWNYPLLEHLPKDKFYLSNHHYKMPDLAFIFHPKFIRMFTEMFDNVIHISDEELYSLWEPNAEALKFNSYRRNYPFEYLTPIPLPVRIVRGQDCRGPQW